MSVKLLVIVILVSKRYPSTYCLMQGSCFIWISFLNFKIFTSNLESQPLTLLFIFYSFHGHSDLAAMVRSSMYLQTLPPLDLECFDLDGDYTSMPVIFEDIYHDQLPSSGKHAVSSDSLVCTLSPSKY